MEKPDINNELESFLSKIYSYFQTCFQSRTKPLRKEILQKDEYLPFLWKMHKMINCPSKEIKKSYQILNYTLSRFLEENYKEEFEALKSNENEEDKKKLFFELYNFVAESFSELSIVLGRIYFYSDKEQTQVAHFLDQTSQKVCKKSFQSIILSNFEKELIQVFKTYIEKNFFLPDFSSENELSVFLRNILCFFDMSKLHSERFLQKIIDNFVDVLTNFFSNIVRNSEFQSNKQVLKILLDFTKLTSLNLSRLVPPDFLHNFTISLNKFYELTICKFTKSLLSVENFLFFFELLQENDSQDLKTLSLIFKFDNSDTHFLKEPLILYLEKEGSRIIEKYIDSLNSEIIEEIYFLIDKISNIVNDSFAKNPQLLFAKTKGIEKFINLKIKNKSGRYSQDIILEKLIDYTIEIITHKDVIESTKNCNTSIIIEILSFLNAKIYFKKIGIILTEKIINEKQNDFEKELINQFILKFGEDCLSSVNRILIDLEIQTKNKENFQNFKKQCLQNKPFLDFEMYLISQQDLPSFAHLFSSTQFKFIEQILETFFYKNIKNEKKKIVFNFELGKAELEIDFKQKKTILITQPILILLILNIGVKKKTLKEIMADMIKEIPQDKNDYYENLFKYLLKELVENHIFVYEDKQYFFNKNFSPDTNTIIIDLNIYKIMSESIKQNLKNSEKKYFLQSKIMKDIKYNKRLRYEDFVRIFEDNNMVFDSEVLNNTLNFLIDRDYIKRMENSPHEFIYINN